jgi:hypothetical protein
MSLSRTLVASLCLSIAAIGCGNTMPAADTGVATDSGVSGDAGGMMMMMTDGGADAGGSSGTCGDATRMCMCACGMNAMCQQNCLAMNRACNECVIGAQLGCCPTESAALQTCITQAMAASDAGPACTDNMCIAMRCGPAIQAVSMCANSPTTQMMPTCRNMLAGCFGSYPLMCN